MTRYKQYLRKLLLAAGITALMSAVSGCSQPAQNPQGQTSGQETEGADGVDAADAEELDINEVALIDVKADEYVTPGEYQAMEIEVIPKNVITDEMLDTRIKDSIGTYGSFSDCPPDGVAEMGDALNIDFEGTKDKIPFDGGSAKDVDFILGSGNFIPGFEDGITGMAVGETKEVTVTFPDDYPAKSLAGAETVFAITVNDIRKFSAPKADDQFAASLGIEGVNTLDDYREYLRNSLEREEDDTYESRIENAIMEKLVQENSLKSLPKWLVDHYVENIKNFQDSLAQMSGYSPEEYVAQYYNMTYGEFQNVIRRNARHNAEEALIMKAIADRENIVVTAADVDDFEERLVTSGGYTNKDEMMFDWGRSRIDFEAQVLHDRVMEVIRESLIIKDASAKAAEPEDTEERPEKATEITNDNTKENTKDNTKENSSDKTTEAEPDTNAEPDANTSKSGAKANP